MTISIMTTMYKNPDWHFRWFSFYTFLEVELLGQVTEMYFKTLIDVAALP